MSRYAMAQGKHIIRQNDKLQCWKPHTQPSLHSESTHFLNHLKTKHGYDNEWKITVNETGEISEMTGPPSPPTAPDDGPIQSRLSPISRTGSPVQIESDIDDVVMQQDALDRGFDEADAGSALPLYSGLTANAEAEASFEHSQKRKRTHSPIPAPNVPKGIDLEAALIQYLLDQISTLKWIGNPLCNPGCTLDVVLSNLLALQQHLRLDSPISSLQAYKDLAELSTVFGKMANRLYYKGRKIHSIKISTARRLLDALQPLLRRAKLEWPIDSDLVTKYIFELLSLRSNLITTITCFMPGQMLTNECLNIFARAWNSIGREGIVICPTIPLGDVNDNGSLAPELKHRLSCAQRVMIPLKKGGHWVLLVADTETEFAAVLDTCASTNIGLEQWDFTVITVRS
ncbi:hypothetical protein CYLTODRAFT_415521 [Cylindrobasidium torrendii FP15055 ss-10]|uniref:Uncharacterized protein n=1 Tax=Cylindrobasidium torrendii FP15055 ss-10 TaxID=1314674 RepID=A0A0D7ATJ3_9AGAR|nr:hypothetical protein CYLTODRAFT_415521 [Cylindrobasidium torrendii FP15055 ss-10]